MLFEPAPNEVDADDEGEHEAVGMDESSKSESEAIAKRFLVALFVEHDEEDNSKGEEAVAAGDYWKEIYHREGKNEDDALIKLEREMFEH